MITPPPQITVLTGNLP